MGQKVFYAVEGRFHFYFYFSWRSSVSFWIWISHLLSAPSEQIRLPKLCYSYFWIVCPGWNL